MMRKVEFEIPYSAFRTTKAKFCKRFGMNAYWAGKHWAARKSDADVMHAITKSALNRGNVRYLPFEKPARVTFWHHDNMDIDNHAAIEKMIIDALKDWVLHNDGKKWLREKHVYFHERECIRVLIEEVEP